MLRDCGRQIDGIDGYDFFRTPVEDWGPFTRTQHQLGAHLRADPERKSGLAASSTGTAITPQSAHPRNAATHSAQFGLHNSTASPLAMLRASSSRAN